VRAYLLVRSGEADPLPEFGLCTLSRRCHGSSVLRALGPASEGEVVSVGRLDRRH
jgi:hypothetical protein